MPVPVVAVAALAASRIVLSGALGRLALAGSGAYLAGSAAKEVANAVAEKKLENQSNTDWNDDKNITKPSESKLKPSNNSFDGLTKKSIDSDWLSGLISRVRNSNSDVPNYDFFSKLTV